jgi:hypothetical protein
MPSTVKFCGVNKIDPGLKGVQQSADRRRIIHRAPLSADLPTAKADF